MIRPGEGPSAGWLADGRLHLSHGPIDLVILAEGEGRDAALAAASRRFATVLPELGEELPVLRRPLDPARPPALAGPVARRMLAACLPLADVYLTPMAAVAGSVADEILAAMLAAGRLDRALVNNGGDIALHVAPGFALDVGVVRDLSRAVPEGAIRVEADAGIGGIATSGWRGRSFSLGIADAATVLSRSAAEADAAATVIGNAVDVDDPAITRRPARAFDPDSDLGDLPVTVDVGPLDPVMASGALERGVREAERLFAAGRIRAALLALSGQWRAVEPSDVSLVKDIRPGLRESVGGPRRT